MSSKSISIVTAALAVGALAVPAGAAAHHETSLSAVKAHTDRADAALDRAMRLFDQHAGARAERSYDRSRSELAKARRSVDRLRRSADTRSERARAAQAQVLVAEQQGENVEQLVSGLDEARGRVENEIAKAALADTRGRDKAIGVIEAILARGVSDKAATGLARALAELSTDRHEETEGSIEALTSDDVSSRSKRSVAQAVDAGIDGQQRAGEVLAGLIADESMPEQAKDGLRRAYDAVTIEQAVQGEQMEQSFDRLPSFIRSFVQDTVRQARENARGMAQSRPAPPAGRPSDTPSGQPSGTPSGQPSETPSGQPSGTPTGPRG